MGTESARDTRDNAAKPTLKLWAVLFVCMTVFGCGYSFAGTRLSGDYHTIAVPAFKNESFEPDIQIRVTNLLIRELNADGRLRVVNDPATADLVLKGIVTGFEARALSYSASDNISQFRIMLFASGRLEDVRTGKIIWQKEQLKGTDFYQTQGGRTREEAIEEASEELVEAFIYECLDSFW